MKKKIKKAKAKKAPAKRTAKRTTKRAKARKVKRLSRPEIKRFKKILLEKKKEVLEELNKNLDDGKKIDFNEVKDSVDMATDTYDTEFLHNLSDVEKRMLEEIEFSLEKVETGAFGLCETCGKLIGKERLETRPFSKNCIVCQTNTEK